MNQTKQAEQEFENEVGIHKDPVQLRLQKIFSQVNTKCARIAASSHFLAINSWDPSCIMDFDRSTCSQRHTEIA